MRIVKHIPARDVVTEFKVIAPFLAWDKMLRTAKEEYHRDKFPGCWRCRREFVDGEMTWLGQPVRGGNKLFCEACARAVRELEGEDDE